MEKTRLEFSPMYGADYLALLPIGVIAGFGWLCFIKGWAFTLPAFVMVIAILFGIVFPAWIIFIITTKITLGAYGIGRKTWFSKKFLPWEEVGTVLLHTEKGTTTVIITDKKITEPAHNFNTPKRYFSFTNRPHIEEFIVLMMKNRLPILKQQKGFNITDLKDIADLFR